MTALISFWGHVLAAIAFAVLAAASARSGHGGRRPLIIACVLTAIWASVAAANGPTHLAAALAESLRNTGWLMFMMHLTRQDADADERNPIKLIQYALLFALAIGTGITLWGGLDPRFGLLGEGVAQFVFSLRMIVAVGALVVVHSFYSTVLPGRREAIAGGMGALAALWAYDLNLYTFSYLSHGAANGLFAARGIIMAATAPALALIARSSAARRMSLSRTVALRSLALVAAAAYLFVMFGASALMDAVGGKSAALVQIWALGGALALAVTVLPSKRSRAWLKVMTSKHLFAHRYDYRAEWLRFTNTIGSPGSASLPLGERLVKALADIAEAPGGLLLLPDETGMHVSAAWHWGHGSERCGAELGALLSTGRILALDALRSEDADRDEACAVPEWLLSLPAAWAIVPLIHFDRLAGAVVLEAPLPTRTLDWEDFDLLRTAGRQLASYLAESQGQEALAEAERFDEFNRRFAFIMHDIKNIVSQLALVARNAERHADNPEFRADMVATLNGSTARMNDLLARLSQHNRGRAEPPRAMALDSVVSSVAATERARHPVILSGDKDLWAMADPARLESALSHIVANAIDASPTAEPVTINLSRAGEKALIAVIDKGAGMSDDFIRTDLFRPFASTKTGGFGIGAYEARSLIMAMGGTLTVSSGASGSIFTINLPAAAQFEAAQAA